ncbi:MAG: type 1 glutamine amidotransferase [Ruegeria sp.]
MTTILIVEGNTPDRVANGQSATAGFIRTFARLAPATRTRAANPYANPLLPDDLIGVDSVVFTGSGVSWSVDSPDAAPQRAAMEMVLATGLPTWGSCNGLNLAAVALGGRVGASAAGIEVGVARGLTLTKAGTAHPMMKNRAAVYDAPCIHRDEVQTLPNGAVLLAGNGHSAVQTMTYEQGGVRFWGTQYHPELNLQGIGDYVRARGIFAHYAGLADDLEIAETDMQAAARLGTTPRAFAFSERSPELENWLEMVAATASDDKPEQWPATTEPDQQGMTLS